MRYSSLLVLVVATAALAAGCGGGTPSVPSNGVAVVGEDTITKSELDELLAKTKRTYKAQKRSFPSPGTSQYQQLRAAAVQFLVQKSEYEQGANDLGIEIKQQQIDDRLKEALQQAGLTQKSYRQLLKRQGITDADVRDNIRNELLQKAVTEKVTKEVKVTDSDLREYYQTHKKEFSQAESRDVRHILFKANQKKLADQVYKQLGAGGDFVKAVKKYTQDPGSKTTGGKYTDTKGTFDPTFEKTAFSLKTNEISKPIKTQFGWHIIQALGPVKPPATQTFDKVKDRIKQTLLPQKKDRELSDWQSDVRKRFEKEIAYRAGYAPPSTQTTSTATTNG
jgi:parvulin-like peptidyl-prolyl isomerase